MNCAIMSKYVDIPIASIIFALLSSVTCAKPCGNVNQTSTEGPHVECSTTTTTTTVTHTGDNRVTVDDTDDSGLASHTVYTIIVMFGVVMIPIIILTRICWLRKLQRQRCEVINEMRQIVDQRLNEEEIRRSGVFTLDLTNIPVEKPPSYEESVAHPDIGYPPPYDQPPSYKQNQFNMSDNIRHASEIPPALEINSDNSPDGVTVNEVTACTSSDGCFGVNNEAATTSSSDCDMTINENASTSLDRY